MVHHADEPGHVHDPHEYDTYDHSHDYTEVNRRSLVIALILIEGFMVAEVVGGILSGSLALLSDAGHMITDAAAIAPAWSLSGWHSGTPRPSAPTDIAVRRCWQRC